MPDIIGYYLDISGMSTLVDAVSVNICKQIVYVVYIEAFLKGEQPKWYGISMIILGIFCDNLVDNRSKSTDNLREKRIPRVRKNPRNIRIAQRTTVGGSAF